MTGEELLNALLKLTPADRRHRQVELRVASPFQSAEGRLQTVTLGFTHLAGMAIMLTANEDE